MMKIAIIVSLIAIGSAAYIDGNQLYGGAQLVSGGRAVVADSYDQRIPYDFGYDVKDEYGTQLTRRESSDGLNAKGSYSFTDARGIVRVVEYVADGNGFRATVKTNEPGTKTSNPADVLIQADPIVVDQPQLIARPLLQKGLY